MSTLPTVCSAPHLYALSLGEDCEGPHECHWCSAPCKTTWEHDDPYPIPFLRGTLFAKRPANGYICRGCWLLRRKRITLDLLGGGYRDGQSPMQHSLWLQRNANYIIDDKKRTPLYSKLIDPPRCFCLSLIENGHKENLVHTGIVNDLMEIKATTPLIFTHNTIPYTYTVYELEQAIQHGGEGKLPGVQLLLRYIGPVAVPKVELDERKGKKGKGRPELQDTNEASLKRLVRASGS